MLLLSRLGCPLEPEDSQYGKSRSRTFALRFVLEVLAWLFPGPALGALPSRGTDTMAIDSGNEDKARAIQSDRLS